jgi:hypothetical protein
MKYAQTNKTLTISNTKIPEGTTAFLLYHLNPHNSEPFILWDNPIFQEQNGHQPIENFTVLEENFKAHRIQLCQPQIHRYMSFDKTQLEYEIPTTTAGWLLGNKLIYIDQEEAALFLSEDETKATVFWEEIGVFDLHLDYGEEMVCYQIKRNGEIQDAHFQEISKVEWEAETFIDSEDLNTAAVVEWLEPYHYITHKIFHRGQWFSPKQ